MCIRDSPTTMPFPSVVIPPAVAKKMGEFTHWFAKKVGLASGSESKPVYGGATHLTEMCIRDRDYLYSCSD